MNLEGKILLRLRLENSRVAEASIESLRPIFASRVLEGRAASDAVSSIGLLFSLCGRAQTVALATAIDAARGQETPARVRCLRALQVLTEAAREHIWRLALDLPRHVDEMPLATALKDFKPVFPAAIASEEQAWWEDELDSSAEIHWMTLADQLESRLAEIFLGEPLANWLARSDGGSYTQWINRSATPLARAFARLRERDFATPCLNYLQPPHFDAVYAALFASPEFARQPRLKTGPAETGPIAAADQSGLIAALRAQNGCGAALRIIARLVELAHIPARMRALARADDAAAHLASRRLAPHVGGAAVETARGWLMHDVEMEDDRLAKLRIVAPTEWNFHPRGAWVQGMVGQAAENAEAAKAKAALLAFALDPCVMWEIEVE